MAIRVLVVDDAMFMRSMIKDILVNAGGRYEIVGEASNGREAIARFRELSPNLVTMDIVMPQLDGIEATREILKVNPAAVIVMCSAMGQEALVVESISAGAKDFIVKPFTSERVLQVLSKVLPASTGGAVAS
ncbi:MAG TPA: response regulator [Candidatus Binatia bacterium]|jgi:two-component system, chemotaxis family, chemotaxis protein CheY|nr:response regulator [Candidatus Binatia bacterium]